MIRPLVLLHHGSEQSEYRSADAPENVDVNAVGIGDLLALPQGLEVVQLDVRDTLAFVHPCGAFKVQIQAAEIEVYRAHHRRLVV